MLQIQTTKGCIHHHWPSRLASAGQSINQRQGDNLFCASTTNSDLITKLINDGQLSRIAEMEPGMLGVMEPVFDA